MTAEFGNDVAEMMWLFEHVASQCSRVNAKTKAEFGLCILRLLFLYVKKKTLITLQMQNYLADVWKMSNNSSEALHKSKLQQNIKAATINNTL